MLITPEYLFKDITHITPAFLAEQGVRGLVLDIDNTLTDDGSQELPDDVAAWLDEMRAAGVRMTIASNGTHKRVAPFAKKVGLASICLAAKPLPLALIIAQFRLGVRHSELAMVGDQLFADRLAATLYGVPAYIVIARGPDIGSHVKLKRKWERRYWKKFYNGGGQVR